MVVVNLRYKWCVRSVGRSGGCGFEVKMVIVGCVFKMVMTVTWMA